MINQNLKGDLNMSSQRDEIIAICPYCSHEEILTGLSAWSAIILGYKCKNCNKQYSIINKGGEYVGQSLFLYSIDIIWYHHRLLLGI